MGEIRTLALADVARLLGVTPESVHAACPAGLPATLRYQRLSASEEAEVVARVEQQLASAAPPPAGPQRHGRWEEGWSENLIAIRREGFRAELLAPRYFRPDVLRLGGEYVRPLTATFELDLFAVLRRVLFALYCADVDTVVELGCGTGANLLALVEQLPQVRAIGCDWARSSQELLRAAAEATGCDLRGVHFDMFHPERAEPLPIGPRTAVLTVHALEQLGGRWEQVFDYVLRRAPRRCVHLEPLLELYDGTPHDQRAAAYHRQRNYLDGYLTALRARAAAHDLRVVTEHRVRFGSLFHEAYSFVVWEPLRQATEAAAAYG